MPFDRGSLVPFRIQRSRETADEARLAYENGRYSLAENRMYYAMFYLLHALALENEFKTSKHAQLIGWFNKNFVRTQKVPVDVGKLVQVAYDKRQEGDYDDFVTFEMEEVAHDLQSMDLFLEKIEHLLGK